MAEDLGASNPIKEGNYEQTERPKTEFKKLEQQHSPGEKGERLGEGGSNVVYEVPITVKRGSSEKVLNMVVRESKDSRSLERKLRNVKIQLERREQLKNKGVPVIPTYRLDEKTGDIYMTNLTIEHSKKQYILGNVSEDLDEINRRIKKGDFVEGIVNKEDLLEMLWTIIERCADEKKTGIGLGLLNSDALFFLIDSESLKAKVLVGDYKYVSSADTTGDKFSQDEMMDMNLSAVRHALRKWYLALGISSEDVSRFFDEKINK